MDKHMTNYLLANNYIDKGCQKAGVPAFPGCVAHSSMIWEQIQSARRSKADLHVVWLDLANVYGSVPHQLITFAVKFFHIPACIQSMIRDYFKNLCLLHNLGSLHQLASAGERDSHGLFHLSDPIHSSVRGYSDRHQAGSPWSQSSVRAASPSSAQLYG